MDAALDSHSQQTAIVRSNTDTSIVRLEADSTTHALSVDDNTTGTPTANNWAATDSNGRTTMFAVSNNDPTVLVALVGANGALLIDSN